MMVKSKKLESKLKEKCLVFLEEVRYLNCSISLKLYLVANLNGDGIENLAIQAIPTDPEAHHPNENAVTDAEGNLAIYKVYLTE